MVDQIRVVRFGAQSVGGLYGIGLARARRRDVLPATEEEAV